MEHRNQLTKLTDTIAGFTGSWIFVFLHAIWMAIWFGFHLDIDVLTFLLSIEAILLATFILMSQNRQVQRDEARSQKDLETDMKAEREIREVKQTLQELRDLLKNSRRE